MIKCPECKKEVSESAVACPSCGFPVAKHIAAPEKEKASADKKEAAGGCLGIVGLLFCIGAAGSLFAYIFFPDSGSRPNEERLDNFETWGIFGSILVFIAWRLIASGKKIKK